MRQDFIGSKRHNVGPHNTEASRSKKHLLHALSAKKTSTLVLLRKCAPNMLINTQILNSLPGIIAF
jgi:hypothetical protein